LYSAFVQSVCLHSTPFIINNNTQRRVHRVRSTLNIVTFLLRRPLYPKDVLVPKVGELMGGSQREERLEVLERRIEVGAVQVDP
jgi:hypothetical protein